MQTTQLRASLVIRPSELAKELGVTEQTLRNWSRSGILPPKLQLGPQAVGYLRAEVEEWLHSRPIAAGGTQ